MDSIDLRDVNILDIGNTIQIAGVIWTGNGMAFVTQFPGKDEDFSNLKKLEMDLPDWQRFLRQTDLLETEILAAGPDGITKVIVRKTARQIDSYMQWEVFRRDSYKCRYCGRTGIPLTVDHIDLWENGGATIPENLLSACRNCNKERGRTSYTDWLASDYYKKRSNNLSEEVKKQNLLIITQLSSLESKRRLHGSSR